MTELTRMGRSPRYAFASMQGSSHNGRWAILIAAAALGAAAIVPASASADSFVQDISDDGQTVLFRSNEALVPADTDGGTTDAYVRSGGVTFLASPGTSFDADQARMTPDGSMVVFETLSAALPTDTDGNVDIYAWRAGGLTHISRGEAGTGNGAFDVGLGDVSDDGTIVFFTTPESLSPDDTDTLDVDVYMRDTGSGTTELVSTDDLNLADGDFNAFFNGATSDGLLAIVTTNEIYDGANDGDNQTDVYVRHTGVDATALYSRSTGVAMNVATDATPALYKDFFYDGVVFEVFFETVEDVNDSAEDSDNANDVWMRTGAGATELVSTNDTENNADNTDSFYEGRSGDGSIAFFSTEEEIEADDNDGTWQDIWARDLAAEITALASTDSAENANGAYDAGFAGADFNGQFVWIESEEELAGMTDFDGSFDYTDVFERDLVATNTTQVSVDDATDVDPGGPDDAFFMGASEGGDKVYFRTTEALVPDDTNGAMDIYLRDPSDNTIWVTRPEPGASGHFPGSSVGDLLLSGDGTRAALETDRGLVTEDGGDGIYDVYAWEEGDIAILSVANPPPVVTPPAQAPPLKPEHGVKVLVEPAGGVVLVKVPGGSFVPIEKLEEIPVGSIIDAKKGFVKIVSERGDGTRDEGIFWAGIFQIGQKPKLASPLDLKLVEKIACKGGGKSSKKASAAAAPLARAAAARSRQLWGKASGSFRTSGSRGSATVRGTEWQTVDKCAGSGPTTTFRVKEGVLAIDDFKKGGAVDKTLKAPGKIKLK